MTHELPLRFLICSRPEHNIQMRFERSDLQSATAHLVVDMDGTVTQDITTFLEAEFSRIHREERIQETPWPPEGVIQCLAERASELFIYASTVIKFIDDRDFQPQQRLDMVLGALPHGIFSPFAEIDLLYTQILDDVPASKIEKTRLCLGIIIYRIDYHSALSAELGNEIMLTADSKFLNELLQLNPGGVEHLLRELQCVLHVQPVSIRHKSFSDFLRCKTRSGRYYIDKEIVWAEILGLLWATIPRWLNRFDNVPFSYLERRDSEDVEGGNLEPMWPDSRMWLLASWTNILMMQSLLAWNLEAMWPDSRMWLLISCANILMTQLLSVWDLEAMWPDSRMW